MKTGRHFEIQDGGCQCAFLAWHWPSKILFITNLGMYQVSCFYHKMHDFFTYPHHYIDKPYISLDNKVEGESKYWIKKVFDKTIAAQVQGSNFVIFNFLENDDCLWNSIESLDFLNSVT